MSAPWNNDKGRLPGNVVVMADTPVDEVWERFHFFEALHHQLDIMNPLSSNELDQVIATLSVDDDDRVLDLACGHGELLLRLAHRYRIQGVGVDLSPWQISRAAHRARDSRLKGLLEWQLGRAESVPRDGTWDVAACLGASWIWGGFEGTVQALAAYARPGGLVAIGDLQVRPGINPATVTEDYGQVLTTSQQRTALEQHAGTPLAEIQASTESWIDYDQRIAASADVYADHNPGDQAAGFRDQQQQWSDQHHNDHKILSWTVWIGRINTP